MSIYSPKTSHNNEDDDLGPVFIEESDIIHKFTVDDDDLPDASDDDGVASDDHINDLPDASDGDVAYDDDINDEKDDSVHTFVGHTDEVYTVACSPTDATLVATGGGDEKGFLWRIGQENWAFELQGHKDSVSHLGFSADGQLLASGDCDGIVQIWDISSGNLKCKLVGPGKGIEWVKWHPNGHLVLAGAEDCSVWMWNADKGTYLNMFTGHASTVTCGDFTPNGKTICTGSLDATLRIWNPRYAQASRVVRVHPYHNDRGLTCMAISSDSTLALTGSSDGSVHIVSIASGKVVSSLAAHSDSIECIGIAPSSPWVATGSKDKKLIIWDIQHSLVRCTCDHEKGVSCLAWLGASRYIATGCLDGKVRIWDCLSGNCVRTFDGHVGPIQSLSVSANRDFLVSASVDKSASVFEIAEFQ